MTFNQGFLCPNCGPVPEASNKTIRKVQYKVCKRCDALVNPWERPLNERPGRCFNCGNGSFIAAMYKSDYTRCCKKCLEVFNVDTNKILRKGKEEFKYEPTKNKNL